MNGDYGEGNTLCRVRIRTWNSLLTWVFLLNFSLMVSGLVTPRWVRQGSRDTMWRGSLMRCGGCIGDWEDLNYFSISKEANKHNVKGFYKTFSSLYKSGLVYLVFEVLSIVGMSLVLALKLKILKKGFSARIFLFLHTLITVFHTIGTISWFSISRASFFYTCSGSSDYFRAASICATTGPVISVVTEFLLVLNIILQILVNKRTVSVNAVASCSSSRLEKVVITTEHMMNHSK